MVFSFTWVLLLHCTYLFFMNTWDWDQPGQAWVQYKQTQNFIACVLSPYFHLAWFYPIVMLLTSVELLQVLLISAIRIRFLMRTGLTISRENCVLKLLPEEQHSFPNQTNCCCHLFAMRVVAEVLRSMLINKGTPVSQSIKAVTFSLWIT